MRVSQVISDLSMYLFVSPPRNVSQLIPPADGSIGLAHEGTPSDGFLQQLLTYAESVTNWISAEIVICDSVKVTRALTDESSRNKFGRSVW